MNPDWHRRTVGSRKDRERKGGSRRGRKGGKGRRKRGREGRRKEPRHYVFKGMSFIESCFIVL